jgi:hypothetical protein
MTDTARLVSIEHKGMRQVMTNRLLSGVYQALKRFFWMDEQLAFARRDGYGVGQPGREECLLARAATQHVMTIVGDTGEELGSAVLLIRSAMLLLIRAHLDRLGIEVSPTTPGDECWKRFISLSTAADLVSELTANQRNLFASVLGVQGEVCLAKQSEEQRKFVLRAMTRLARKLPAPFEGDNSRVKKLQIVRWFRLSALAIGIFLVLGLLWQIPTASDSNPDNVNYALHQKATVSLQHPAWTIDPSHLVDGNRAELGMHSNGSANPFATIDLGSIRRISRVVVYNRTDCCWERAVPLIIEVSEDGNKFKTVDTRNNPFKTEWTANFSSANARFVRLIALRPTFLHLNEVEVY